ncbi:hypothetical protein [Kitasatospora cheerisanensis]|uniref:Uncharacterized protein n=1 Tax=Kitasatospora cheerisanensis KCTC 2395 TaxID=1348663 RepID=A0A066YS24_9ACTN|nr:hypothetical protein [Kitasatospora cheerisanensis]KDN84358.1 hypothetical protein KCH_41490 [Kitasatospora cheerisanensis KCTC 2395]
MSNQDATGYYRVDLLRALTDGTPIWGVRRPDGTWRTEMGAEEMHVRRDHAEHSAAQLNQINGLAPAQP